MPLKNLSQPGGFVLRQCIGPLGLSIIDAAALGVTHHVIGTGERERGISPEMAVRLSKVFGGSGRKLACPTGAV
jgi:plasmid maintenance system antidote protein VapI